MIFGTGGLSHQLQAQRAGLINAEWDARFLDMLVDDPESASQITHLEYLREAGSEGIELVMWLIMRGAMNPHVKEIYRATHVPTSNTHNGVLVLENATRCRLHEWCRRPPANGGLERAFFDAVDALEHDQVLVHLHPDVVERAAHDARERLRVAVRHLAPPTRRAAANSAPSAAARSRTRDRRARLLA